MVGYLHRAATGLDRYQIIKCSALSDSTYSGPSF